MVEYFSPALLAELFSRRDLQTTLLFKAVAALSDEIILQRADGSWHAYPRLLDPNDQATSFNDRNVEVGLSKLVPGLLGVFSRRVAYSPNTPAPASGISNQPSPNLGVYAGVLMLDSEWQAYDAVHSHSMGVELKGVKGKSLTHPKAEGVTLVGLPTCAVVQALHFEKHNCELTSRHDPAKELLSKKVGSHDRALPFNVLTLQARRKINTGEELTILYSRHWQHSAISCAVCCLSVTVTDEDTHGESPVAFKCKGYIDGSHCPFTVHRRCATARGVSKGWDYCHFCFVLSANDDFQHDSLPWLDTHCLSNPNAVDGKRVCVLITTASFAAALHRAISLSWTITSATVSVAPSSFLSEPSDASRSRVIHYDCQESPVPFAEEGIRFRIMHNRLMPSSPPFLKSGVSVSQMLQGSRLGYLSSLLASSGLTPAMDEELSDLRQSSNSSSSSASTSGSSAATATKQTCIQASVSHLSAPAAARSTRQMENPELSEMELATQLLDEGSPSPSQSELPTQVLKEEYQAGMMDNEEAPSLLSQDDSHLSLLDPLTSQSANDGEQSEDSRWSWADSEHGEYFPAKKRTVVSVLEHSSASNSTYSIEDAATNTPTSMSDQPLEVVLASSLDESQMSGTSNASFDMVLDVVAEVTPLRIPSSADHAACGIPSIARRTWSWWTAQPQSQQLSAASRSTSALPAALSANALEIAARRGALSSARRCLSSSLASLNLIGDVQPDRKQPQSKAATPPTPRAHREASYHGTVTVAMLEPDAQVAHALFLAETAPESVLSVATVGDAEVATINEGWYTPSGSETDDDDPRSEEPSPEEKGEVDSEPLSDSAEERSSDSDYLPNHNLISSSHDEAKDIDRLRTDSDDAVVHDVATTNSKLPRKRRAGMAGSSGPAAADPSLGSSAIPGLPPSSPTEADAAEAAVYDNLQPRVQDAVRGHLSLADKHTCKRIINEHRQRDAALAQKDLSNPRFLRKLFKGSKRALKKKAKREQRLLCDDKHCPHEQCNLEKFELRFQRFTACCLARQRRCIQAGLLSHSDRSLWENRAQRLDRVAENPVELLKVQLNNARHSIGKLREIFFAQYGNGHSSQDVPKESTATSLNEIEAYSADDTARLDEGVAAEGSSSLPSRAVARSSAPSAVSVTNAPSAARRLLFSSVDSNFTSATGRARQLTPKQCAQLLGIKYASIPLCLQCYADLHPEVSKTTVTEWCVRIGRGHGYNADRPQPSTGEHSARHRTGSCPASKTALTQSAVREIARRRGDAAPTRNLIVLTERTIEQLTESVNLWVSDQDPDMKISQSLVKKVMRSLDGLVKLAGREHSIPVCDQCSTFSKLATPSEHERNMQKVHLAIQQSERTAVDINCRKAISCPEENLTIYMDGMDQAKTALPNLLDVPHWQNGTTQWKVHVTGVLVFGPFRTFAYLNYENVHSSAALSIHILNDVLRRVLFDIDEDIKEATAAAPTPADPPASAYSPSSSRPITSEARRRSPHTVKYTRRPKRLYLVMDNSGKDNKNNHMFRFLALLVQRGIFEEIWINFLIVGHTHDRVDQFFSCISRHLATKDTWTPSQLQEHIAEAYRLGGKQQGKKSTAPESQDKAVSSGKSENRFETDITLDALCRQRPEVVLVERIADWATWLGMSDNLTNKPATASANTSSLGPAGDTDAQSAESSAPRAELESDDESELPVTGAAARRAQGLACFTGMIKNIQLPQVFFISKNLQQAVELRVKPHSFMLELVRGSDAKLKVEAHDVALQEPMVLITAETPVPYVDPRRFPPYPFPSEALQATFNKMVAHAKGVFSKELQQQWLSELGRFQTAIAQQDAACEECKRLISEMDGIRVASAFRQKTMTDVQLQAEKSKQTRKSRIKQHLLQHMQDSKPHPFAVGAWTEPWTPCDSRLLDPVQLRIPGLIPVEIAKRDDKLRKTIMQAATTGYIKDLHRFITKATIDTADYHRFRHGLDDFSERPIVSIAYPNVAAQKAAILAAEVPVFHRIDGQDRSIPIAVGDLVAVKLDNYQWPEYPVSIALVVDVVQPKKRKRQPSTQKGKRGKTTATVRKKTRGWGATVSASSSNQPDAVEEADDEAKSNSAATPQEEWGDEHGKTQLRVQFFYLRFPSYRKAQFLLDAKVERYKSKGVHHIAKACLIHALHRFKMDYQELAPSRQIGDNASAQLVPAVDSEGEKEPAGENKRGDEKEEKAVDSSNSDDQMSDVVSVDSGADDDYLPDEMQAGRDSIRRLRRQRVEEDARLRLQREKIVSLQLRERDGHVTSTTTSLASASLMSNLLSAGSVPSDSVLEPGLRIGSDDVGSSFPIHDPLSRHFMWTSGAHHHPGTWWRVFTEMNDYFETAKPSAKVLKKLTPFLSVTDLEEQKLGMVLLPHGQRVTQDILQEEVLCWEQCNLALTRDGYFTQEFAVKVHHCLELNRQAHGGYYGNDHVTDDEQEDQGPETGQQMAAESNAAAQSNASASAEDRCPAGSPLTQWWPPSNCPFEIDAPVQAVVVQAASPLLNGSAGPVQLRAGVPSLLGHTPLLSNVALDSQPGNTAAARTVVTQEPDQAVQGERLAVATASSELPPSTG